MKKLKYVERYAYKNTSSSAGNGERYKIKISEIVRVNVWVNYYGNPSYGYIMKNGDTYLLIDAYDGMNDLSWHLSSRSVSRKKDLI